MLLLQSFALSVYQALLYHCGIIYWYLQDRAFNSDTDASSRERRERAREVVRGREIFLPDLEYRIIGCDCYISA